MLYAERCNRACPLRVNPMALILMLESEQRPSIGELVEEWPESRVLTVRNIPLLVKQPLLALPLVEPLHIRLAYEATPRKSIRRSEPWLFDLPLQRPLTRSLLSHGDTS